MRIKQRVETKRRRFRKYTQDHSKYILIACHVRVYSKNLEKKVHNFEA